MASARQGHNCDDDLDMEYLQILRRIKPYITCIMNNYYIELIRVWLEKLSDVYLEDKKLRNMYLVELGKQIETEAFEEPFVNLPPEGVLPPFKECWKAHKPEKGESNDTVKEMWPYITSNDGSNQTVAEPNFSQFGLSQNTYTTPGESCCTFEDREVVEIKEPDQNFFQASSARRVSSVPKKKQKSKFLQSNVDVNDKLKLVENFSKDIYNNIRTSKKKKQKLKKLHNVYTVAANNEYQQLSPLAPGNLEEFCDPLMQRGEVEAYSNMKKSKQKKLKQKRSGYKQHQTEEGSWFDLTEVSSATGFGSGDTEMSPNAYEPMETIELQDMYETKIANLLNVIDDLKKENMGLSQHVDQYEKDLSLRNTKAETSLHNLAGEVECLKSRLQELVDIKLSLQNSHFAVTTEWQNTITTLHKRLNLLQRRNNELKAENNELEKKLNNAEMEKKKELMLQKKKIAELHAKEIDMLKQIHARAATDIEAKYNLKLEEQEDEFVKKLDDLKDSHEERLNNMKEEYENRINCLKHDNECRLKNNNMDCDKIINSKDAEIERLENLLQEQCFRMQEEVQIIRCQVETNAHSNSENYIDKIAFLQKCIFKMERLFQKSEKENLKQLVKLKRELEYREKTNQLALTTQRADLISNTFNGRQNEIDVIVAQLEEHYKKLLTEQQRRYIDERKHDTKVIAELQDQLSKHRADINM